MFYRVLELIARVVYWRRIRQIDRIGEAAKLAGEGDPEAALARLASLGERRLHHKVRSYHALTTSRILDALGRVEEAEDAIIRACKLDPANMRAHLDLAMMAGRKRQFKNATQRLERLVQEAEPELASEARRVLGLVAQITSGKKARMLGRRALKMAARKIGPDGETAGLPADLHRLDQWVADSPEEARAHADDIAILIGESAVRAGGASWRISLALDWSVVVFDDGETLNPFEAVAARFRGDASPLAQSGFQPRLSPK